MPGKAPRILRRTRAVAALPYRFNTWEQRQAALEAQVAAIPETILHALELPLAKAEGRSSALTEFRPVLAEIRATVSEVRTTVTGIGAELAEVRATVSEVRTAIAEVRTAVAEVHRLVEERVVAEAETTELVGKLLQRAEVRLEALERGEA